MAAASDAPPNSPKTQDQMERRIVSVVDWRRHQMSMNRHSSARIKSVIAVVNSVCDSIIPKICVFLGDHEDRPDSPPTT